MYIIESLRHIAEMSITFTLLSRERFLSQSSEGTTKHMTPNPGQMG